MRLLKNSAKRKKKRKGPSALLHAARWLAALLCTLFLTWSLFVPESSGMIGRSVGEGLHAALGGCAYLVPLFLFYALYGYFRTEDAKGLISLSAGAALILLSASMSLELVGASLARPAWGGLVGGALTHAGASVVGRLGAGFTALVAGLLGLQVLFEIAWFSLIRRTVKTVSDDFRSWRDTRREFTEMIAAAAKRQIESGRRDEPRMAPIPEQAKRKDAPAPPKDPEPDAPEILEPEEVKPAPKDEETVRGPEPHPNDRPYVLPPLDLLPPVDSEKHTGRPSETDIQEAISSLETALANFKIDAKVTGVRPGPVITRYEVRPAPGVTVNTITARANDIALAMRARSIRMIAPIPGKAAIGIEVPNQKPAIVTLRNILESEAMPKDSAPLAFALGLSSEGTPLAADIQTMPHVLLAGATNSGKSVMVHSLIASILFRQRPDQVKFVLIDPKHIELTLYQGIPHLYDPQSPPDKVEVITTAKKASGALKALVGVMEDRLEKYQVWKARDIMQFNRMAAKRGEKGDFYIVVVIDELADLMIISRDIVEDSVQRLTQMARAVGIHLVIATQRPSVDVITGVIKANLPSRIAMRVASKVDSKVVIDGNGAESLLGRGDALYVSAGMPPERIQGSYVTAPEIEKLVGYLKTQGAPDYPLLDGMIATSGDEHIRSYGVDPLHFTKALKLILERRRVSQDLLKSQFGSSARATNLLNVIELMKFIEKPEGTNRWTIHFEKIEDYLSKNYPQIDLDEPGI